ncbi:hypothetical protein [Streptomyces massasporeus]|uniref:hypothetical protein n=1 Tax=Streptomyces massasporeus TaxID=67324 RepID=UPI0036EA4D75
MVDATALFSLASGIGGALIGGIAGVYGPGRIDKRRRQHELELERSRRWLEDQRRRQEAQEKQEATAREEKGKVLEAIQESIACIQNWHRRVEFALLDLKANREIDIAKFDEMAEETLQAVVRAVSLLGTDGDRPSNEAAISTDERRPATFTMQDLTLEVRRQIVSPSDSFNGLDISVRAKALRDDLMKALCKEREERTDLRPIATGDHVIAYMGRH